MVKEKCINDYIDDNFWIDFIEDTCNIDAMKDLKVVLKSFKKSVEYRDEKVKVRDISEDTLKKIYNYTEINYDKPITYKYFKKIVLETPSLINIFHIQLDLLESVKGIELAFSFPMSEFSNFDAKGFLTTLISERIDDDACMGTKEDIFNWVNETPNYLNGWALKPELGYNYWLWLWVLISLMEFCSDTIYKVKKASFQFRKDFDIAYIGECCIPEEEETEKEEKIIDKNAPRKAHNAYSNIDKENWFKVRNVYNSCNDGYRLLSFLVRCKKKNLDYEQTIKALGNLDLDTEDYDLFMSAINNLSKINDDNKWFIEFRNYMEDRWCFVHQRIFERLKINNKDDLFKYFEKVSSRESSLNIVRDCFDLLKDKSDKTILNKISDIAYQIKNDKYERFTEEYFENLAKEAEEEQAKEQEFESDVDVMKKTLEYLSKEHSNYLRFGQNRENLMNLINCIHPN